MVRDHDLIFSILRYCSKDIPEWEVNLAVEDLLDALGKEVKLAWTANALEGHIRLMVDAGLIETKSKAGSNVIVRLTWSGYEYLERHDNIQRLRDSPFLR